MSKILQQTYSITLACSMEDDYSEDHEIVLKNDIWALVDPKTKDYHQIALGNSSLLTLMRKNNTEGLLSPTDSTKSTESCPLVSHQVLSNAAFLFSPSYAGGDIALIKPKPAHHDSTTFSLSTMESCRHVTSIVFKIQASHDLHLCHQ